jgi:predicted regulator of amino acid metabolism with ACT domain
MHEDPIVKEMRANGLAFARKYGNDPHRISHALRAKEAASDRKVVYREVKRVTQKAAS